MISVLGYVDMRDNLISIKRLSGPYFFSSFFLLVVMDISRRTEGLNEAKRKPVTTIAKGTHSPTIIKGVDITIAITSVRKISLDSPIRLSFMMAYYY